VATTYSSRPSAILGLSDPWLAYQLDLATLLLGRRIEGLVADGKMSVASALAQESRDRDQGTGVRSQGTGIGDEGAWANQKWRDPRPYVSRTMKIPDVGFW
jgi:hypothetical protein